MQSQKYIDISGDNYDSADERPQSAPGRSDGSPPPLPAAHAPILLPVLNNSSLPDATPHTPPPTLPRLRVTRKSLSCTAVGAGPSLFAPDTNGALREIKKASSLLSLKAAFYTHSHTPSSSSTSSASSSESKSKPRRPLPRIPLSLTPSSSRCSSPDSSKAKKSRPLPAPPVLEKSSLFARPLPRPSSSMPRLRTREPERCTSPEAVFPDHVSEHTEFPCPWSPSPSSPSAESFDASISAREKRRSRLGIPLAFRSSSYSEKCTLPSPASPIGVTPLTEDEVHLNKLRRHLGNSVPSELVKEKLETQGTEDESYVEIGESDLNEEEEENELVSEKTPFRPFDTPAARPRQLSQHWVWEKKGERWIEDDYQDIIHALRKLR